MYADVQLILNILTFADGIGYYQGYQKHTLTKFWWEILSVNASMFELYIESDQGFDVKLFEITPEGSMKLESDL